MRFISTKAHGILDYLMGVVLIASPWIFGFAAGGYETWLMVAVGAIVLVMAAFTDYKPGLVHKISMNTHLWMDGFAGGFLAASPWIFGFADFVYLPHLIFGLAEIGAALCTHRVSATEYAAHPELRREHRESHA